MFFRNFRQIADGLPDDLRLKFYDAMCAYVFDNVESDDVMIKSLIIAIKPSLDKEDRRGGARPGAGAPKNNQNAKKSIINEENNQKQSKTIKHNQNQSAFLETETEIKENNTKVLLKKNTIDWEFVKTRWNEIAKRWNRPMLRGLTPQRKQSFEARLKEYGGTIEDLLNEIDYRLETSLILRGKQMNKDGELENSDWGGADFDFICRPTKFLRLIEGGYKDPGLEHAVEKKKQMELQAKRMRDENQFSL